MCPPCDTALFRSLPDLSRDKIIHKPIIPKIMIQILQSKFPITSFYLYVVMPLVLLLAEVAQIEH